MIVGSQSKSLSGSGSGSGSTLVPGPALAAGPAVGTPLSAIPTVAQQEGADFDPDPDSDADSDLEPTMMGPPRHLAEPVG